MEVVGGGNNRGKDYEIFSPPYLTTLQSPQHRPRNVALPEWVPVHPDFDAFQLSYGGTDIEVTCDPLPIGVALKKAVLIAPGSTTHHSDFSQRYYELPTTSILPDHVRFQTTPDSLQG